ncbi:hypothetical protein V8C35DRAFT_316062 [Trichoderma chlorosporum]
MATPVDNSRIATVRQFLDKLYTEDDGRLLAEMVSCIGEGKDTAPFLVEHGFQREPDDWKCFEPLVQPGPHFYLRFAGGVYKISGPSLGITELVVNSADEKIYVDSNPVQNQKQGEDGTIHFSIPSGHRFKIKFQCGLFLWTKDASTKPSFSGTVWASGDTDTTGSPVTGSAHFPWGDATGHNEADDVISDRDDTDDEKFSVETAGLESASVSMDLQTAHSVPGEAPARTGSTPFAPMMMMLMTSASAGDIVIEGTHVTLVLIGVGVGIAVGGPTGLAGALTIAGGAHISRLIAAAVKHGVISRSTRKMKIYITKQDLYIHDILTEKLERAVNKTPPELLEDKDTHKGIREQLAKEYASLARGSLSKKIRKKFRAFRWFDNNDYTDKFGEGLASKFATEIPTTYVDLVIREAATKRLINDHLPTKIEEVENGMRRLNAERERAFKNLEGLPISEQNRQRAKLAERFNEDHAKMEKGLTEHKEKLKELREKKSTDVEKVIRDIEEHARRQRELELERLRGKPKRSEPGKVLM